MTEEKNTQQIDNDNEKQMSVSRYVSREQAFIVCFERLFADCSFDETIDNAQLARDEQIDAYAVNVAKNIEEKQEEIDKIISSFLAKNWSISRISKVSLCLLRIAVYEILYVESVPVSAAINEAVELAKKYSDKQDSAFINGILGSFSKTL